MGSASRSTKRLLFARKNTSAAWMPVGGAVLCDKVIIAREAFSDWEKAGSREWGCIKKPPSPPIGIKSPYLYADMIFLDDNQSKRGRIKTTLPRGCYGYLYGVKPVQLEYDSEGVPFPPKGVEYEPWVWSRFIKKLQRRARKFESTGSKVTYERLIKERLVL